MENITERGQNPSRKTKSGDQCHATMGRKLRRVGDLYTADTSVSQSPKSATVCLRLHQIPGGQGELERRARLVEVLCDILS